MNTVTETVRIGRNIRTIREMRNYDQKHVAGALYIGRSTLSTWENGTVDVKIENLIRLAEVLKLKDYRVIINFDPDTILDNL